MTYRQCKLCRNEAELQESHILPKFVYKWLKETSGSGYIRFGENPNQRVQDGFKYYWLCKECEKLFNQWETQFSKEIFHPMNQGKFTGIIYSKWFILFCVSISWRVLNLFMERNLLSQFPPKLLESVGQALEVWREFLLDERDHPGKHEQHFIPMDAIVSHSGNGLPPNFNRYILRSIDIDIAHNQESAFVYSKLGRFVMLGFIEVPYSKHFVGTKVHVKRGVIEPRNYTLPSKFGEFISYRAKRADAWSSTISEHQVKKIQETYMKDLDRLAHSDSFKALEYDIKLFGKAAFKKND